MTARQFLVLAVTIVTECMSEGDLQNDSLV
jgi:hypothetical protein